ncbi:MAG: hypothetical protein HGA65_00655 [Oscillochloris sp.]|nr:hypothetical protein [Oscillochloris sp.]
MYREEATAASPRWPILGDRMLVGIGGIMLLLLSLKNAWFSDDGLITFRTVINVVNGYGLTWNIDERVQVYTHPLWMLFLSVAYFITHEVYYTFTIISLICSCSAFLLIGLGLARNQTGILASSTALILSKSFIDFSTSGLENPLSHLLLAAFCVAYLRLLPKHLWLAAFLIGLLSVNRIDLTILVIPALVVSIITPTWPTVKTEFQKANNMSERLRALLKLVQLRSVITVALGMLPFVIWEIFSLIYYGFLVPNTAYAKLNTGIPQSDLSIQGVLYLMSSIRNDPVTLLAISTGILAPLATRNWRATALSFGIVLYLLYIVRIGGDFMTGRFLTAPLIVAASLIASELRAKPAYLIAILITLIGLINPRGVLSSDSDEYLKNTAETDFLTQRFHGIIDERAYYFDYRSLAAFGRNPLGSKDSYARSIYQGNNQVVNIQVAIGLYGIHINPEVHIVDPMALSDPLLARLPSAYNPIWRIGHFERVIPDGYTETLERGVNVIQDKNLAAYYDKLHLITSGPIFSPERWAAIWGMLTGSYNNLIDVDRYRYPNQLQFTYDEISQPRDEADLISLPASGALIDLGGPHTNTQIEIMLSRNKRLSIEFLRNKEVVHRVDLVSPSNPLRPLDIVSIPIPSSAMGYDYIRLLPMEEGEIFISHIRAINADTPLSPEFHLSSNWDLIPGQSNVAATSPASIFVTAEKAQPYWLDLTPGVIYEPDAPNGEGHRGTLIVQTSAGYTTTIAIETDKPVSVPLNLPAGTQRIDLSLAAGTYTPVGYVGDKHPKFSFFLKTIRLRTITEMPPLPPDVLINGKQERAEAGQLIVFFDDDWYGREKSDEIRWGKPHAGLRIYSPITQTVTLKLPLRYISDGNDLADHGILTVITNEQAAPAAEAWTWQPFIANLTLQAGWNTVKLNLDAPPFIPSKNNSNNADSRTLSIGVEHVEILHQP